MSDYKYIQLSESNFSDLVDLIKVVYLLNVDIVQLKKKYDTDRFGTSFVGYLAYCKDTKTAAAYYGILPIKVKINGNVLMAAQSGDTITHPKHRNKGLFVELAKRTYTLGQTLGIQFVYGFPNQYSYPGLVRKL